MTVLKTSPTETTFPGYIRTGFERKLRERKGSERRFVQSLDVILDFKGDGRDQGRRNRKH